MDRLAPAYEAAARAGWATSCHATPENRARSEAAYAARAALLHDEIGFSKVEESLAEGIDDRVLERALSRLKNVLAPHRIPRPERLAALESGFQERFALYRAEVGGRRLAGHDVAKILREETDEARLEATWRAAVAIGAELGDRVREAATLRNQHARELGYADYRSLRLETEEIDPAFLDAFLAALETGTDEPWRVERARIDGLLADRFGRASTALAPWHHGDVFFQGPPAEAAGGDLFSGVDAVALTRRTFDGVGLDVSASLAASDLFPCDAKNPHAFCADLDRRGDVRVLANVVPSRRWMRAMLHEFGHAAYALNLDLSLPWILVRPAHTAVTEGMAMLFERLVYDVVWQTEIAGVKADPGAAEERRRRFLVLTRWALVMSRFEEGLYADPDSDLDALWWDLVERYQGIPRPDPLPPAVWAAKIHTACFPVYYHAYLLGASVAARFERHIHEHWPGKGLVREEAAGRFLQDEVFSPSAAVPWLDLLERAVGEPLGARWLLDDLAPPAATEA